MSLAARCLLPRALTSRFLAVFDSRFLRARKFDVQGAFDQFSATEAWRKKEKVTELYDEFDVDEYSTLAQSVYPQFTGRRTKEGAPLYVFRVGSLTKEKINEYSKKADRLEPRMIVLSEVSFLAICAAHKCQRLRRVVRQTMPAFTLPLCSSLPRPNQEKPIDCTVSSKLRSLHLVD